MTHKYNLIRKAEGTNPQFHLDGKLVTCSKEHRSGLGFVYLYSTNDAREAQRLQIVHGFKIEHRAVKPNIDRLQMSELGKEKKPKDLPAIEEPKAEETSKPKRKRGRSKK